MKKIYAEPEFIVTPVFADDILTASKDEVFVDGGNLFD